MNIPDETVPLDPPEEDLTREQMIQQLRELLDLEHAEAPWGRLLQRVKAQRDRSYQYVDLRGGVLVRLLGVKHRYDELWTDDQILDLVKVAAR